MNEEQLAEAETITAFSQMIVDLIMSKQEQIKPLQVCISLLSVAVDISYQLSNDKKQTEKVMHGIMDDLFIGAREFIELREQNEEASHDGAK